MRALPCLLVAASLLVSACGSSKATRAGSALEKNISAIAGKCRETNSQAEAQIASAREVLEKHKLHGSEAELADDFEHDTTYALKRDKTVNCTELLALLVLSFEKSQEHVGG